MTQAVFPDIDPNVTSGTELAILLNDFKASLLTQHSGSSAPTYADVYTQWFDTSVTDKASYKIYDGSQWVTQFTLDTVAHTISYGGNNPTASFSISRTDTAADMYEMFRDTGIASSGGVIYSQNNDGATKKTFGKMKIVADNVTSGAEEASLLIEGLVAGTLESLLSVSSSQVNIRALAGTGTRNVAVDEFGNLVDSNIDSGGGLFENGNAESADSGTYTATGLSFTVSSVAGEILKANKVFKAVSSAVSETLETETVTLRNLDIESPFIVAVNYKSGADWTMEILDNTDTVLSSETLKAYTPTTNEGTQKKMFAMVPAAATGMYVRFTSTTNDTLIFDDLKMYTWASVEEALMLSKDILNTQTGTVLATVANRKNQMLEYAAQIDRSSDTESALDIYKGVIYYDGANWNTKNQNVNELDADSSGVDLKMTGNNLVYDSTTYSATTYTGSIIIKITRII